MNLLFDTNIILQVTRKEGGLELLKKLNPDDQLIYISFVNVAEIQSIAYRKGWNEVKSGRLETFLNIVRVIDISDILLPSYVGIDAYSQRNHPDYTHYPFRTPRNMGKNDLWIAATASLLNLELVTTDGDFDHLQDSFLNLRKITPAFFQP
ncbi:PIN domain nuclease [Runella rosea]|uniref:PIN domain nuclease n=1 Tax=Runella rosea TaxID=2259595 RepID=A0A344TRJ4_9BACT|nr:type II toxin-antitoxin system VapC family toxin [Runella rosea]AXE21265.1 PIN domain nuclease [Runella rosea]